MEQSFTTNAEQDFVDMSYEICDLLKARKIKEAALLTKTFIDLSIKLRNEKKDSK